MVSQTLEGSLTPVDISLEPVGGVSKFKSTGICPWPLSKMELYSTICNSKILNLLTTKSYFEITHGLLVSVFDKVYKPKLS